MTVSWVKLSTEPAPETGQDRGTPVTFAVGTITRPAEADWPRLVRGQRVAPWGGVFSGTEASEWRVTEVETSPDGDEMYQLEPAGIVDARIEAQRQADSLTFLPPVV